MQQETWGNLQVPKAVLSHLLGILKTEPRNMLLLEIFSNTDKSNIWAAFWAVRANGMCRKDVISHLIVGWVKLAEEN